MKTSFSQEAIALPQGYHQGEFSNSEVPFYILFIINF